MIKKKKTTSKIVVIGGGTGSYTVLVGLKNLPLSLTSIVTMMDSGGSSGRLRDELGTLPPGDIRQSIIALSTDINTNLALRKLFDYRFTNGSGLEGHNFGNLFVGALTKTTGSMDKAVNAISKIFNVKGNVLPVTLDDSHLVAAYSDGEIIRGEHNIDEPKFRKPKRIKKVWLDPQAHAFSGALAAIKEADLIVLGPGDLFTSLIANLCVEGIANAIRASKAKKAYIVNLMTKFGQTDNFGVREHVKEIEKYLGAKLDFILINREKLPADILERYKLERGYPVIDNLEKNHYVIIRTDLLGTSPVKKIEGDTLKRSLIRHSPTKLAIVLYRILK